VDKVRRIAFVGNGATTRDSDGFDGEIWTTASVAKILPRVDRIFEVHKEYDAARLNGYNCPVMMDGKHSDIKRCEDLEIDKLVSTFGPVYQFSFDYMAALALQIFKSGIYIEVATYGIDLTTDTEYSDFRQSFFYWVGMLRGSGVRVDISQGSAILNRRWVYCHERDELAEVSRKLLRIADKKVSELEDETDDARIKLAASQGYRQCAIDIARTGV
jgi:hypothetical protein